MSHFLQLPLYNNCHLPPGGLYPYPAGQWWPAGPSPAVLSGQPLWGGGASPFGGLEHAGSVQARTTSADATKRSMRLCQEAGLGYMFVLRGGLSVPSASESELAHLLRFVVDPNKRVLEMITPPMANIDIDAVRPPVQQGTTAVSRAPEVRFQTFIDVLVMLVRQGEEQATGASQGRRDHLVQELQTMAKSLNEYMTTHFNFLLPKQKAVRRRVIYEANRDINEFFGFVFDAAAPVKRQFSTSAPTEGVCAALSSPTFTHLRKLISRGSYSPLGRMDTALEVPKTRRDIRRTIEQEKD